ncbi:MAG: hypothetical protein ACXVCX_20665 [Ktedonobacterales bacterium]
MQDEQNMAIGEDTRQLILDVTETLSEIIDTLRQGNAVPQQLIERGEQVWSALDEHPIEDSGTMQTLVLEGEGNLERTILYRLEHDEPIDAETLDAADKWIREARRLTSSAGQGTGQSH